MDMGGSGTRAINVFGAVNLLLFLAMLWFVYYDRFLAYRGPGNVIEFFIYACVLLLMMGIGWLLLQRHPVPTWLLWLVQGGILLHFSGAFVAVEGGRLYDVYLVGIRFDKYVHCYNAFAIAGMIGHLIDSTGSRIAYRPVVVALMVLGCGALVEIVEFGVTLTVPDHGVGNYENNMGDMVANLVGGLLYLLLHWIKQRRPVAGTLATAE